MIQETATAYPLQQWWTTTDFEGKNFCDLKENGKLCLRAGAHYPERVISTLTPENADHAVKALKEKFLEVQERMKEANEEWNAAEDKLKLYGKITRLKDYLLHTNVIGDVHSLMEDIIEKEKQLQTLMDEHYEIRLKLVQQAEELAKTSEDWKETTQIFKNYNEDWKNAGYVDKERNDELWNRLETARAQFFERKHLHHEEQEKEMLRNLDLKMEIVEKAESLAASTQWKETTELFHNLLDEWKAVGRTMHDKNEELWNRFITAKNNFFENKKEHFELIQTEQLANYEVKLALVEKAEAIKGSEDWNKTAQEYADIMTQWKATGRVPVEKADELWNRMCAAKDYFFNAKRSHHEMVRVSLEDNYAQKMALLKRAESIKNSTHWRTTTEEMNELMDEWKKIGAVPREHSNKMWEAFIGARKYFFARKDADREKRRQYAHQAEEKRIEQRKTFLHKLEDELKEEKEKLADFKNAIENITPGNKAEELRAHLTKLIGQCEHKIEQKEQKITEVHKEFEVAVAEQNIEENND